GGQRLVLVLDLLGAELLDGAAQLGLVVAELARLARVVLVDRLLDRHRAGHRRLVAEQRGRRTEREARDVPQGLQRRRPHAALDHQPVEDPVVLALGAGHGSDLAARVAVGAAGPAQRGKLALVDAHGAVFAGLVDADRALDQFARLGITGIADLAGLHPATLP